MNKFVNVVVAAAVAATGALFAPTAQAAPKQQEVCYDITYVHEKRWSKEVPAVAEVTHQEYKYERTVKAYKTQYQYAKFTQTKTRDRAFWKNFSPNKGQGPLEGAPAYPNDPRGTWSEKKFNGGPAGSGVFQQGNGNGSWFYRQDAGAWSDFGPWTLWSPLSHMTWSDSNVHSIGGVSKHGSGVDVDTEWYRQWQVRNTGNTREVPNGTRTETTDWVKSKPEGEGWTKVDERTEVDVHYVPGYTEYYVAGGDHTRTLGESNWTTDTPAGWTFVDERDREVKNEVPCVNPPKRITKRFQVDTYSNPSTKLANKAAGYDNDGKLKWGEDRPHYGHSRWQIVNVVGYDNWTKAQWTAAINKATTRSGVGNVTSTHHIGKVKKGQKLTVAWEIKKDSWPNKGKRGAQTFFARGLK